MTKKTIVDVAIEVYNNHVLEQSPDKFNGYNEDIDIDDFFNIGFGYHPDIRSSHLGIIRLNIGNWCCTDTWVGWSAVYLDSRPFAIVFQSSRKSYEDVHIVDNDLYKIALGRVVEKYLEFRNSQHSNESSVLPDFMRVDVDKGFKVSYATEIINNSVILDATGELVNIHHIPKIDYRLPSIEWKKLIIKNEKGELVEVTVDEISIPFGVDRG